MSKQSERLFAAIGGVDDRAVDEAAQAMEKKRPFRWQRLTALAAALLLVAGAGFLLLPRGGGGAGGAGSSGSTFMSYAGPVMPLALREENGSITARREITLDFAPWIPVWISNEEEAAGRGDLTPEARQEVLADYNQWYPEGGRYEYSNDILVTDAYTLTNASSRDQTVSVLYPFAASAQELDVLRPTLSLEGRELDTVLHPGGYSGGFNGAWGSRREGLPEENLAQAENWEAYRAVLSDGSYREAALADFPELSGIPVVVYRFTDPWVSDPDPETDRLNYTIRASFLLEQGKSSVLTTGFHGGTWDVESGAMTQSFTIPREDWPQREGYRLVVLGEDVRELTVQAYNTGGPEGGNVVTNAGVTVERYESDLETVLGEMAWEYLRARDWPEELYGLYFGLMKDELAAYYQILSDDPAQRYADSMISEGDLDFASVDRVFYLEAEVTIPAGGSVVLTAEMAKGASFDFHCANTANRDVYGYDLVTRLGSNLTLTGQTACLEDRGQIEIIRENFGFDLKNGVNAVTLDSVQEHYYLEVRRK